MTRGPRELGIRFFSPFSVGSFFARILLHLPHSNIAGEGKRIGFEIEFLTKFLDDSAWFFVEKLKKQVCSTKNLDI